MPKERVRHAGSDGWADLLVQWGRDEMGDDPAAPRVRLFVTTAELGPAGSFMFHPDDDSAKSMGVNPGDGVGPIDIMVDREQINRLIRVLRRARNQAYGGDE
jgi:hypothetical protein